MLLTSIPGFSAGLYSQNSQAASPGSSVLASSAGIPANFLSFTIPGNPQRRAGRSTKSRIKPPPFEGEKSKRKTGKRAAAFLQHHALWWLDFEHSKHAPSQLRKAPIQRAPALQCWKFCARQFAREKALFPIATDLPQSHYFRLFQSGIITR